MSKESLGTINFWGFSPSLDLVKSLGDGLEDSVNILLVGCGDSRHILTTLSKLYKKNIKSINIYVIESSIELYARYIIQMIVGLIAVNKMGLQDKTELFLELYGNTLIRAQSMEFVAQMATSLIRLITDPSLCSDKLPFFDLEQLKFKERDILESVFKIWRDPNRKSFDASLCWDLRVRQNLGTRYDAIPNVFDWDCSMTLHDRGAEIINTREYNHWRHKGVAFQLRDAEYDVDNRTLASGRVLKTSSGDKTVRLGYWGDIVCSPYLGFGITSANQDLFKKANHQYTCGASRVAEYNVTALFYELAHSRPYVESSCTDSRITITEVDEDDEEAAVSTQLLDDLILVPQLKVILLPLNALADSVPKKEKFHDLFDLMYFSTSLVGGLATFTSLSDRLRPAGRVVIETPKYVVNVTKDQVAKYEERVEEMCRGLGLEKHAALSGPLEAVAHLLYVKR